MKNRLTIWALLAGCITYTSCDDLQEIGDIDDIAIEAEYALPIFDTQLTIAKLFDESDDSNSFLDIDAEGNMTILFDTEGPSMSFSDVASFPSSIPFTATTGGYKVNMESNTAFQPTKVRLKGGTAIFEIASSMQSDVDVMLMIPELMNDGEMFTKEVQLVYDANQSMMTMDIGPLDLTSYELDISSNHEFTVMYSASDANGTVNLQEATGSLENLDFEVVEGTWTNESFVLPKETIEIGLYENWESGTLTFADPKVRIDVNTNVGFPSTFSFEALTGTTVDQQTTNMSGAIIGADNALVFPTHEQIGEVKMTSIYVNNENSNIADFFTSEMTSVDIDLSMQTNPGATSEIGFITDQAAFTSQVYVELPVYGTAKDFTLRNDFEADLADVENIKEAEITVTIDNGLPIELDLQLYFKDQSGNAFDSLFVDNTVLIASATVDGNGDVTSPSANTLVQDLDEMRAANIFNNTKRIDVKGVVSTANNGGTPVRLNASQAMDISVSGIIKVKQ